MNIESITGELSNSDSLIVPQVNILNLNSKVQSFSDGAKVEFFVGPKSIDSSIFNTTNDFCLARANSSSMWECTTYDLTQLDDGFLSFPIKQMGVYSLVVNPKQASDSGSGSSADGDEGFFEKFKLWIILSAILLILIIVALVVYFLCCRSKKDKDPLKDLPPAVMPA